MILFPTPVLPVRKTGLPTFVSMSKRVVYRTVSTVGTMIEKKGSFGSYTNVGTILFQWMNFYSFSL